MPSVRPNRPDANQRVAHQAATSTVLLVGQEIAALMHAGATGVTVEGHLAADLTHAKQIVQWLPTDVLVVDLRTATAADLDLVEHVQESKPDTSVVALVGPTRADDLARDVGPACGLVIGRGDMIPDAVAATVRARATVARVLPGLAETARLPARPRVQAELVALTSDPATSLEDIAAAVERDLAAVTDVLRLINSAYFAMSARVESIVQAVRLLGVDVVQGLAVASTVYGATSAAPHDADLAATAARSLRVATTVRRIAQLERWPVDVRSDVFVAALLHDVGLLVMAAADPVGWARVKAARAAGDASEDAEVEAFGCTVAEASAAILDHWGFNDVVTGLLAATVAWSAGGRPWRPPAAAALVTARWSSRGGGAHAGGPHAGGPRAGGDGERPGDLWLDDQRWSRWLSVTGGEQLAAVPRQATGEVEP